VADVVEQHESDRDRVARLLRRYHEAIVYSIVMVIVVGLAGWQWHDQREQDARVHRGCVENAKNRDAIRQTLFDALPALGARWDPKLRVVVPDRSQIAAYFADPAHESERAQQLAKAIRALARFPEIAC
jgi:hypothetical protein